jgi:hypothetical protein
MTLKFLYPARFVFEIPLRFLFFFIESEENNVRGVAGLEERGRSWEL